MPGKTRETVINTQLSWGAREALWMRAELLNSKAEVVCRSLLITVIRGEFAQPGTFKVITRSQMFEDPRDYMALFEEDSEGSSRKQDFEEPERPSGPGGSGE
jgi:hypothetical protein